jgi:hypothetical protein
VNKSRVSPKQNAADLASGELCDSEQTETRRWHSTAGPSWSNDQSNTGQILVKRLGHAQPRFLAPSPTLHQILTSQILDKRSYRSPFDLPSSCPTPPLTHTHTHGRARARTHAHTHTHAHTQARACTHARTRTHARTHARTHTHTHTHARTHAHVRTRAHTHTRRPWPPAACGQRPACTPFNSLVNYIHLLSV